MSNIEYEVQPNKLTTPVSYAARVRARGVVSREQFARQIAVRGGTDVSNVNTVLDLLHRVLVENLHAGLSVEVDDLMVVSLSITAKMDGPNDPLPSDAQLNISLRSDRKLIEAVRADASITRIEPSNQAAQIIQVSSPSPGGDVGALVAGMVLQTEGYRQSFDPLRGDEGVFLVGEDGTQVRFETYLATGDRKLQMFVPATLSPDTNWMLEVRNRTKGAAPTAPLYVGYWNAPLHSA